MDVNQKLADAEFLRSGEDLLFKNLQGLKINTVFDVGSNRGNWTRRMRQCCPVSTIHTFEVIPEVFMKFVSSGVLDTGMIPNNYGLSDELKVIAVKYCNEDDTCNTALIDMAPGTRSDYTFSWKSCLVSTGDIYMKCNMLNYIDFLKLDVEGAEHLVLKGFKDTLAAKAIGAIQFEYGTANILSRWQLRDYYELLSPLGYILGPITINGVDFRPYMLYHEVYGMDNCVNYLAVHQSRSDLIHGLSCK